MILHLKNHFVMVAIILKRKEIIVFDSLGRPQDEEDISQFVGHLLGALGTLSFKVLRVSQKWEEWFVYVPLDTPQQPTGSNECGPMVRLFGDALLGGTDVIPMPAEFPQVRVQPAIRILNFRRYLDDST